MIQKFKRAVRVGLTIGAVLASTAARATDYERVAIVGGAGGLHDFTDPVTAMANLGSWCPAPSATTPCLLKIMPGRYELNGTLVTKEFIDIEGSGQVVTTLVGTSVGLYAKAANSEVRDLTVDYTGGNYAVSADAGRLTNVTVRATGTTYNAYGVYVGSQTASVDLRGVTIMVTGTGAAWGLYVRGGASVTVTDASISVSTQAGALYREAYGVISGGQTRIVNSRLTVSAAGEHTVAVGVQAVSPDTLSVTGTEISASSPYSSYAALNHFDTSSQTAGTLKIDSSQLSATATDPNQAYALWVEYNSSTFVGASRVGGKLGTYNTPRVLTCVASYTADYQPVPANCAW